MAKQTLATSQLYIQQLKAISSDIKQVWFADDSPSAAWPFTFGPQFWYHLKGSKKPPADEARAWGISKFKQCIHISTMGIMTNRNKSWLQDFHRRVFLQQGTVLGPGDSMFPRGSKHPTACSLCWPHTWSTPPLIMPLEDHSYLWESHWKIIHVILIDRARWVIMAGCSPFRWSWFPPSQRGILWLTMFEIWMEPHKHLSDM